MLLQYSPLKYYFITCTVCWYKPPSNSKKDCKLVASVHYKKLPLLMLLVALKSSLKEPKNQREKNIILVLLVPHLSASDVSLPEAASVTYEIPQSCLDFSMF